MKKISLLLGLFIFAIMLCASAETLPQPEPTESKTADQSETPVVVPVNLSRELPQPKLPDSAPEPPALPQEAPVTETSEIVSAEPDENSTAPTAPPVPIKESKLEKPAVNEAASAVTQSGSGLPGFDNVPYLGPNVCIYVEDMYENGNKIGIMGDINKQVGIMD